MRDLETSALDEKHKALFRFVDKVNHDSPRITAADITSTASVPTRSTDASTSPVASAKIVSPSNIVWAGAIVRA